MKFYPLVSPKLKCPHLKKEVQQIYRYDFVVKDHNLADAWLVIGGDGRMLKSIKERYHYRKPFFGINCGTFGFLLNNLTTLEDLNEVKLTDLDIITEKMIDVKAFDTKDKNFNCKAVNDVVIGGELMDYSFFKFRTPNINKYLLKFKGTGALVTTPIGSTAYRLNLGYPLLPLSSNIWGIGGIASRPYSFKFVEPHTLDIEIKSRYQVNIGIDGRQCFRQNIKRVHLSISRDVFKIMFLKKENFELKRLQIAAQKMNAIQ